MSTHRLHLAYQGSLFWVIFWAIFFFPIALVLLLTACSFQAGDKTYLIRYDGSRFWLGFWVLFFFPIAMILLFVNGLTLKIQN